MKSPIRIVLTATLLAAALLTGHQPAYAATTITVTTAVDELTVNGTCSLREALANLNASNNTYTECGDGAATTSIGFSADYTIELTLGSALTISRPVSLNGKGIGHTIIQAGPSTCVGAACTQTWGVFSTTHSSGQIWFIDVTVRYGRGGNGAGISNSSNGGSVTIINSLITENYATNGGGLYNGGGTMIVQDTTLLHNQSNTNGGGPYNAATMQISRSLVSNNLGPSSAGFFNSSTGTLNAYNNTFHGNFTSGSGGGGWNEGVLNLTNDTFSGNVANTNGSQLYNSGGTVNMANTILTGSVDFATPNDCYNVGGDTIATNTANLINTNAASPHKCGTPAYTTAPWNAFFTAPANHGGYTDTISFGTGSSAYNAGDTTVCSNNPVNGRDQRNYPRDAACDLGAFEYLPAPSNDEFAGATVAGSLPFTDSLTAQDVAGATIGTSPADPSGCLSARTHTVWYSFTPSVSGDVVVNTFGSNYDTMLVVYTGASVPGLTEVSNTCNDDVLNVGTARQSREAFFASAGTMYTIEVASFWDGAVGDLTVNVFPRVPADFLGDGTSDVVLYRGGAWLTYDFTSGMNTSGVWTGNPGGACIPAPMDWDGNGSLNYTQLCGGAWHFYNDDGSYDRGIWVGNVAGQVPVPADYNGDEKDDVVVFQAGAWNAFSYSTGAYLSGVWTGNPGGVGIPVPVDYSGDGVPDPTILSGGAWHMYNDNGSYNKGIWVGNVAGQLPVPGDYNGDGTDDPWVFRAGAWLPYDFTTGAFLSGNSVWTGNPPPPAGGGATKPAPLDYDGDGTLDFSFFGGGPWHFYNDNGSYNKGIWVGKNAADKPISRRPLP